MTSPSGSNAVIESATTDSGEGRYDAAEARDQKTGLLDKMFQLSARARLALVAGGYTAVSLVMTWPLVTQLSEATPPGQDPLLQAWIARWIQHALRTDPLHLFDANANHPFDLTLAYSDTNIPVALLGAPIQLLTGDAILMLNLLTIASFVLAAMGAFVLVRRLTSNAAVAFVAGLAFAFLPYRFAHLWHLNQLGHAWMPWVLWALFRLRDRPSWRSAALFACLLITQVLTSFGLALQVTLLLVFVFVALIRDDPEARARSFLKHLTIALAASAVMVGPLYFPYLQVRNQQGLERELSESEAYKAVPSSYLTVPPWDEPLPLLGAGQRRARNLVLAGGEGVRRAPDGHVHEEIVSEDVLFPGFLVLVAGAYGLWMFRRQRLVMAFAGCGLLAFVLTLGPTWGRPAKVPLPYAFFFDHVPLFRGLRTPARFGALAELCLVVLAAYGAASAWSRLRARAAGRLRADPRRFGTLAGAVACAFVLAEFWAAPVPLDAIDTDDDAEAPYAWLQRQPAGPVMEFPASPLFGGPEASATRRHVGDALYWSTKHWNRLVNGVSGFAPQPYLDLLEAFEGNVERPNGSVSALVSHVSPDSAPLLQQVGVRYLVIHRDHYDAADWPAVEQALRDAGDVIEHATSAGDSEIYRVRASGESGQTPSLRAYLPTQAVARRYWEPALVVENPMPNKRLLYVDRPVRLTTTWMNREGATVRRDSRILRDLPAVVASGQLNCAIDGCQAAFPGDPPSTPVRTIDRRRLHPAEPGRYTVRLEFTGGIQKACQVGGIEVLPSGVRGGENAWLGCEGGVTLADAPTVEGAFTATTPRVNIRQGTIEVATRLTTVAPEEVRAWFFVADPGETEPWKNNVFKSRDIQRTVQAKRPSDFAWTEPLNVPPGRYRVTVWFHYAEGNRWIHAFGGDLKKGEIVVR